MFITYFVSLHFKRFNIKKYQQIIVVQISFVITNTLKKKSKNVNILLYVDKCGKSLCGYTGGGYAESHLLHANVNAITAA